MNVRQRTELAANKGQKLAARCCAHRERRACIEPREENFDEPTAWDTSAQLFICETVYIPCQLCTVTAELDQNEDEPLAISSLLVACTLTMMTVGDVRMCGYCNFAHSPFTGSPCTLTR